MGFFSNALFFAGLTVLLACGCGGTVQKSPAKDVISAYYKAVEDNDPEIAYTLMGEEYRKKVSKDVYLKRWNDYRGEMLEEARMVSKVEGDVKKVKVEAEAEFESGRNVKLVWDAETKDWRIDGGHGTVFAGTGPKSTLLALVRAVDAKDFGAFLKLLTRGRRKALLRAVFKRLEQLKANIDRPVEKHGTKVRFQYDSRHYIDLVEEDGTWKVYDFN